MKEVALEDRERKREMARPGTFADFFRSMSLLTSTQIYDNKEPLIY